MFEELMEATAAEEESNVSISDAIDDSDNDSDGDSGNDITSDDNSLDSNGDRDDLMDYLDSDSSSLEGLGIEGTEWKLELQNQDNISTVTNYLDSEKNQEYRAIFNQNGDQITAKNAKEIINKDQFKAVIYNPEMNFSKEELHQLAGKIIENKQENAKKSGKEINAIYAVHQRADGTNGHLHIVFHAEKKATLEAAKVDYRTFTKEEMKNWILERSNLVNSVKAISEAEKARNIERLSSLEGLKRETGTEKRDAIIERYQGKSEHNSGNFSLTQVEKSFEHSVSKGKMSEEWKNKFLGEIKGRLKSLEKAEIAKNLGNNKWKIDREKWIEFQKDLKEQKLDKVSQKVQKTIQEHAQKNINSIAHTVSVVPNLENIDETIEKLFEQDRKKTDDIKNIKISNSVNYSPTRETPSIYDVDEFFEKNFSQNESIKNTINHKKALKPIINISSSSFSNVYFVENSVYPQQIVNVNSIIPGSSFKDPLDEIEFERKKLLKKLEIEN
ncbi:MAG: hypothetical protein AB7S49_11315 [Arcobacter sp.]|uniref:hypothetical protein n=1 Tax=Pseudomonadati TaxID=3379134 RepID=UPI003CFFC1B7